MAMLEVLFNIAKSNRTVVSILVEEVNGKPLYSKFTADANISSQKEVLEYLRQLNNQEDVVKLSHPKITSGKCVLTRRSTYFPPTLADTLEKEWAK